MSPRPVPPSLGQFRPFLEAEMIGWHEVEPGYGIVVQAQDTVEQSRGSFGFQIVDKQPLNNGLHDVWVELDENSYHFTVDNENRDNLLLPKGTLMRAGISCEHFPVTNTFMAYLGGISVNRDFSFTEVQTPDNAIIGTVLVTNVQGIDVSYTTEQYTPPETYQPYRQAIERAKQSEQAEYDEWVIKVDEVIARSLAENYPDEAVRYAVRELIDTFHPEGKYRLAALMELAKEAGVLERFLPALEGAINEEFKYAPPRIARGLDFIPASRRGWEKMIRDLGLANTSLA